MKRLSAYLAAATALFWAAGAWGANDSDDYLSELLPYTRNLTLSTHLPNSFEKLSNSLPLNDYDLSTEVPKSFLRISEELGFIDYRKLAGTVPNSFEKIGGSLPERSDMDAIARYGLNTQVKLSTELPTSFLKISGQYPAPAE